MSYGIFQKRIFRTFFFYLFFGEYEKKIRQILKRDESIFDFRPSDDDDDDEITAVKTGHYINILGTSINIM